MSVTTPFAGFSPEAIQFLADLAANNDRAWFQPRKQEYERLLKEPLEAFIEALRERLADRGTPLRADPTRSPFRIHRDVRFSKDKSPYKTHVAAGFPWLADAGRSTQAGEGPMERTGVGGYFHLAPGEIYVGGGMWHPEPERLAAFRRLVAEDASTVRKAIEDPGFVATFGEVEGERLRRVPAGFAGDHPDADLLKLKQVVFGRRLADEDAFSPRLPDIVADSFAAATPVFRLLASLRGPGPA